MRIFRVKRARLNVHNVGLALVLALGMVVFTPPLAAQPAPAPASASSGPSSLPASIPLKRDAAGESAGPAAEGWWLAIAAAAVLLGFAVIAARQKLKPVPASGSRWPQWRGAASAHAVERVSSTRLSPRHSLHVVNWEGRRLLLGCSDNTIQLLAESKTGEASSSEAGR
jgi:hypothetical protein